MGVRFCSLDQFYKKFSGNDAFPSPKLNKDQKKKGLRRQLKSFFPAIRGRPKERLSLQFATIFGRKCAGSFSPGWLFFLCSSSDQLSMRGRINLDGRTLTLDGGTRPPASALQFKCCMQLQMSKNFHFHFELVQLRKILLVCASNQYFSIQSFQLIQNGFDPAKEHLTDL